MKFIDLSGNKYGNLLVLSYAYSDNGSFWKCQCDCGKIQIFSTKRLRSSKYLMCRDCYKKTYQLPKGMSSANQVYKNYIHGAKKRGLQFDISFEDFLVLSKKNCYYCGKKPSNIKRAGKRENGDYVYNGLDRLDSSKGYIKENIVPCCWRCNEGKMNKTVTEFLEWINAVYVHSIKTP